MTLQTTFDYPACGTLSSPKFFNWFLSQAFNSSNHEHQVLYLARSKRQKPDHCLPLDSGGRNRQQSIKIWMSLSSTEAKRCPYSVINGSGGQGAWTSIIYQLHDVAWRIYDVVSSRQCWHRAFIWLDCPWASRLLKQTSRWPLFRSIKLSPEWKPRNMDPGSKQSYHWYLLHQRLVVNYSKSYWWLNFRGPSIDTHLTSCVWLHDGRQWVADAVIYRRTKMLPILLKAIFLFSTHWLPWFRNQVDIFLMSQECRVYIFNGQAIGTDTEGNYL